MNSGSFTEEKQLRTEGSGLRVTEGVKPSFLAFLGLGDTLAYSGTQRDGTMATRSRTRSPALSAYPSARGSGTIPRMAVQMSRERFEELVQEALGELPPEFRRYLNGLEVRTEDYPDDELMAERGLVPPDYPFGMYEGPALPDVDTPSDFPRTMGSYK